MIGGDASQPLKEIDSHINMIYWAFNDNAGANGYG